MFGTVPSLKFFDQCDDRSSTAQRVQWELPAADEALVASVDLGLLGPRPTRLPLEAAPINPIGLRIGLV